jgi:hypothetical protein
LNENGLPGRASSTQEMSPILRRASHREISVCEYISNPKVSVSSFWIFRMHRLSARNNRLLLFAEISPWMR